MTTVWSTELVCVCVLLVQCCQCSSDGFEAAWWLRPERFWAELPAAWWTLECWAGTTRLTPTGPPATHKTRPSQLERLHVLRRPLTNAVCYAVWRTFLTSELLGSVVQVMMRETASRVSLEFTKSGASICNVSVSIYLRMATFTCDAKTHIYHKSSVSWLTTKKLHGQYSPARTQTQ